ALPAPVVAEVRRAPLDVEDFQQRAAKAAGKVRFTGVEVETLLAEVARLTAERDDARTDAAETKADFIRTSHELSALRVRLRGLEQQIRERRIGYAWLSAVSATFVADQLAALLATPEESNT